MSGNQLYFFIFFLPKRSEFPYIYEAPLSLSPSTLTSIQQVISYYLYRKNHHFRKCFHDYKDLKDKAELEKSERPEIELAWGGGCVCM